MLRCVAHVRTDVSEERSASIIRVTRIGEGLRFTETSVLTRATRREVPEHAILLKILLFGVERRLCLRLQLHRHLWNICPDNISSVAYRPPQSPTGTSSNPVPVPHHRRCGRQRWQLKGIGSPLEHPSYVPDGAIYSPSSSDLLMDCWQRSWKEGTALRLVPWTSRFWSSGCWTLRFIFWARVSTYTGIVTRCVGWIGIGVKIGWNFTSLIACPPSPHD
jgi:hypothetical protein